MRSWHCEVFRGDEPGSGNPALVLPRLSIAGRDDYPVVVGLDPAGREVRFAAPRGPLPFCGHGSLAAAWVVARESGQAQVELQAESQTVRATVEDGVALVRIPPARTASAIEPPEELIPALGVPQARRVFLADAGSPKWIVELELAQVEDLRIDRDAIRELSRRHGVNGVYVIAATGPGRFRARAFNPLTSLGEDRATGVAVAGLAACLGTRVVVDQGPPGAPTARLEATADAGGIALGGAVQGRALDEPS